MDHDPAAPSPPRVDPRQRPNGAIQRRRQSAGRPARGLGVGGKTLKACDACVRYVKSIDLTLDGRAIPEVDDLSSLALDLWPVEQGYEWLEPSLAGV